jgi:molybdopterin biosynthesis enzyme MoaB
MEAVVSRNRVVVNMNASSGDVRDVLKPHIFPYINVVEGIGSSVGTSVLNMPGDAAGIRL